MKPFLEELAEQVIREYPKLEDLTMVFPNRRAALFFRGYLGRHVSKPAWSPRLLTIEDLFLTGSALQEADRFGLIYKLYRVYRSVLKNEEPFDRFYFWGDMLLRDFDEIDKYLIPAAILFKDLSKLRELDESFDYLTDEQKKFLRDFWLNFEEKPLGSKEEFLKVWRALPQVYKEYVKTLRAEGIGYEGMIHREVAEGLLKNKKAAPSAVEPGQVFFAGFNALTKSEEVLISHYVEKGARIAWDLDEYYVHDVRQEAGRFFRLYEKHSVLGKTFEPTLSANLKNNEKSVRLFGVPQRVGQAKLLGQMLTDEIAPSSKAEANPEEEVRTVIVLPDESMLMAVLHSLPETLGSVNVTMGYPLRNTPLNNLLELLLELQINRRGDNFNHHPVTAILGHAYILAHDELNATELRLDIIHKNRVFVPATDLQKEGLLKTIFRTVTPAEVTGYMLNIVQQLGAGFDDRQSFDREYAYHFHRNLSRLHEVLKESDTHPDLKGFQKLFRQVIQAQKIPFTGEPLKGLQIMGVLETRNLDFDNVFMLSLNEGLLPAAPRQGSYVPHGIRKAYGLPTHEHQDAMYAYLFYRVLQRAKNINLFYNTEPDILGMGEMSRLLQQVMHESGWNIKHHILSNPVQLNAVSPIVVTKTPAVMESMAKYTDPAGKGISPSVLNDFIECSLRFYLKHIAGLREAEEVEEDLDARVFGNFVHEVMDWFYSGLIERKKSREVTSEDLVPANTDKILGSLIDRAFHEHYAMDSKKEFEYQGQSVVVRAIVLQFVQQILSVDRDYAPFSIELVEEKKFNAPFPIQVNGASTNVLISGRIDRVDSKAGQVRVIDYKTGKDQIGVESIDSLFQREGKRNKAAYQTFLYAWLFAQNAKLTGPIVPMLMNRESLFTQGLQPFSIGTGSAKVEIEDIRPFLKDFEKGQKLLLEELFNKDIPFAQTADEDKCMYCAYKTMCRR